MTSATAATAPHSSLLRRLRHALIFIAMLALLQLQLAAGDLLRAAPANSVTLQGGPTRTVLSSAATSIAAGEAVSGEPPCDELAEEAPLATPIRPGDTVDSNVIIDSIDPVPPAVAFGDFVSSGRRLASCRRCRCLPACGRCFIHKCDNGRCTGFCKIKGGNGPCTILSCGRTQH